MVLAHRRPVRGDHKLGSGSCQSEWSLVPHTGHNVCSMVGGGGSLLGE